MTPEEKDLFFEYLSIPSISARPENAQDVRACAQWLFSLLSAWGLEVAVHETSGAPVLIARLTGECTERTLLVYGHYDVQPVEPLDLWQSAPFDPQERDGFIFARGATDNKGQTFSLLSGLKRLLDAGPPPANIVLLLEGEEEVGSPSLENFLREHHSELACDAALICDTSMIEPGWPALTLGLRGIACFDIEVFGPKADLHSGMFGAAIPNPALALARVLGKLHGADGSLTIPGFYDGLIAPSPAEQESWKSLPWDKEWFAKTTGIQPAGGEKRFSVLERIWARPTAEINGLTSGYQGAGSKTIIPSKASAKLTCRLVPGQEPGRIASLVAQWMEEEFLREGVTSRVAFDHGGKPFHCPADHPAIVAASEAMGSVFGRLPAFTREGLSIPVAAMIKETLDVPVILAGLGLPDCQAHAPNESYPIAHIDLGGRFFIEFVKKFAAIT